MVEKKLWEKPLTIKKMVFFLHNIIFTDQKQNKKEKNLKMKKKVFCIIKFW